MLYNYLSPEGERQHWLYAEILTLGFQDLILRLVVWEISKNAMPRTAIACSFTEKHMEDDESSSILHQKKVGLMNSWAIEFIIT